MLGVPRFDTLILSLPGVVLEKDEEDYKSEEFPVAEETIASWTDSWRVLAHAQSLIEILESLHEKGRVSKLGISEFGILRLQSLLPNIRHPPKIVQINLRDCCDVPADLLDFATENGIKLMPHTDEDNPLPLSALQDVLRELQVPERVLEMEWVVKYTAIIQERGVVENKGYVHFLPNLM
jgi:glutamate--cysteine ligase regulatory subunit